MNELAEIHLKPVEFDGFESGRTNSPGFNPIEFDGIKAGLIVRGLL